MPARSIGNATISFGLVSVPVNLFSSSESKASVSFNMLQGRILGLIGPNGAGKTTLFNCLSRLYQPSSGDILMEGVSILSRPPHRIPEMAVAVDEQDQNSGSSLAISRPRSSPGRSSRPPLTASRPGSRMPLSLRQP